MRGARGHASRDTGQQMHNELRHRPEAKHDFLDGLCDVILDLDDDDLVEFAEAEDLAKLVKAQRHLRKIVESIADDLDED